MNGEDRLREGLARQGLAGLLGIELGSVSPGLVEMRLPFRPELSQHHGFFHGGVVSTLLDNACGFAALSLAAEGASVLSVEFKINFIAPAQGALLVAVGRVVKAGRSLTVCQGDATADGVPCATMLATMMLSARRG